jgi:hypothetical protein
LTTFLDHFLHSDVGYIAKSWDLESQFSLQSLLAESDSTTDRLIRNENTIFAIPCNSMVCGTLDQNA